ncbi:MAG: glutathione S-transferase family protein [bacterium]|nr:glutathione S-transferase family protein [bacterium]MCP5069457.1 glutathione S-transferase family protein [bacterium]
MRALLRYRRIPYLMIQQGSPEAQGLPRPRVPLLPTFFLPDEDGKEVAVTDSTPLIRRFEAEFEGRGVIPEDPVLRFLDALLEDYGDEWLTKAMFHYRWYYDADIEKAGAVLPLWHAVSVTDEQLAPVSKMIRERQIGRLWVVGSNETTAPVIEQSYRRFLRAFDAHLQHYPYLLGERPGAGDFGVLGQLTQLALFDPTPVGVTLEESPRVYAWVEKLEDSSGLEPGPWFSRDSIPETLKALLCEVGRVYPPFLLANAQALEQGAERVETEIDGKPWTQKPFPYQAKCLRWLREAHAGLPDHDRASVDAILAGTGCEALFA